MDAVHDYDFIVVGSGPGGGPLACNLALDPRGYRVALLEAGGDPAAYPGSPTFYNYSAPGLHPRATEDPHISWEFFVQHYADKDRQTKDFDSKYYKDDHGNEGIFYPRAAAIGGCTAHHAMITVTPHRADWEHLRKLTGCKSWSADNMHKYFQRIESCQYLRPPEGKTSDPVTGHGFDGWLPLSMPDPTLAFTDKKLLQILMRAFLVAEIDVNLPEEHRSVDDLKALLGDKKKTALALKQAVKRLAKLAARGAANLSPAARQTLLMLTPQIEKLLANPDQPAGKNPDDVAALLSAYITEPTGLLELFQLVFTWLDPNRLFARDEDRVGAFSTPASTLQGVRTGVRERILNVRALYPDRLHLITGALVTRVIFDKDKKAIGVRYLAKKDIYHATPEPRRNNGSAPSREIYLSPNGEVILSGGTFNTPQLLMLSGVGPAKHLGDLKIPVVSDLPGVGQNLQDRYEVAVIAELEPGHGFKDFTVLDGCTFLAPGDKACAKNERPPGLSSGLDQGMTDWLNHRGVYASNGVVMTIIKRSAQATKKEFGSYIPDLFIFGLPGFFKGYFKTYSCYLQNEMETGKMNHHRFTWAILKGRTHNRCGSVQLRDNDPRSRPNILFRSFDSPMPADEPDDNARECKEWDKDQKALMEAVRFVKVLMDEKQLKARIVWPNVDIDDDKALGDFILREAWGHHACGTCKIGADDDRWAVLDKDFRVRGVKNLRVVDASVFPRIPGLFIISSIYMISEKASDVILRDRKIADGDLPRPKEAKPADC